MCRGGYQIERTILKLYEGEVGDRIVMRLQPNPHLDIRMEIKSPGLNDDLELATYLMTIHKRGRLMVMKNS